MKKWIKILSVILTFALTSIIIFFTLKAFDLTDLNKIKSLILKSGNWGIIIYIIIQTLLLTLLCFVPLLNTSLTILGIVIFGSKITFITTIIAVFISNSILFIIGDKLGEKFASKLIGKKDLEYTQNLVDHKSKFWLPVFFVIPGIPDEALCLIAGMTKMKYWYLILVSTIYHILEIGLFCFVGSGIINWSSLTIIDWFVLTNMILIDIFLLFKLEKYLNNSKK